VISFYVPVTGLGLPKRARAVCALCGEITEFEGGTDSLKWSEIRGGAPKGMVLGQWLPGEGDAGGAEGDPESRAVPLVESMLEALRQEFGDKVDLEGLAAAGDSKARFMEEMIPFALAADSGEEIPVRELSRKMERVLFEMIGRKRTAWAPSENRMLQDIIANSATLYLGALRPCCCAEEERREL
jgi:hypothetical protein